jgi:hypothetical protein
LSITDNISNYDIFIVAKNLNLNCTNLHIDFLRDIYLKRDAITAFWFPFPISNRVRFIITSYGKNNAIDYF